YVESFNSRIRDECLNINSFYSLLHAQVVIGDWKDEYNHHRRHSSLGYLPPVEYARQCTHQMETDDSQMLLYLSSSDLEGWSGFA
ncbi:transposase, partial [Microbacterium sp.]|uniref:transposase n=1 Tax=Microbacterium sp. TaxID=51671 RepID=UPI0037CB91D8